MHFQLMSVVKFNVIASKYTVRMIFNQTTMVPKFRLMTSSDRKLQWKTHFSIKKDKKINHKRYNLDFFFKQQNEGRSVAYFYLYVISELAHAQRLLIWTSPKLCLELTHARQQSLPSTTDEYTTTASTHMYTFVCRPHCVIELCICRYTKFVQPIPVCHVFFNALKGQTSHANYARILRPIGLKSGMYPSREVFY